MRGGNIEMFAMTENVLLWFFAFLFFFFQNVVQ